MERGRHASEGAGVAPTGLSRLRSDESPDADAGSGSGHSKESESPGDTRGGRLCKNSKVII